MFGYTRLMVAAFGLGAGWAALDRAIPYSAERIQAGGPLSEKQGYTHKLIVPHAVRLEAARAYIEETAERIDRGDDGTLNTEGAIAKYLATEAGNAAADAAIQALGGYGYTHEYMVEKIKRDVRITTIYEGTSEIMEMTISRDRWQQHLKTQRRATTTTRPPSSRRCTSGCPDGRAPASPRWRTTRWPRCWRRRGSAGSPATSTCCSGSASWSPSTECAAALARRAAPRRRRRAAAEGRPPVRPRARSPP